MPDSSHSELQNKNCPAAQAGTTATASHMEGQLNVATASPARSPACRHKSGLGSGTHFGGPWFHLGLRAGGGTQREKGSVSGSRKECKGKQISEGRQKGGSARLD